MSTLAVPGQLLAARLRFAMLKDMTVFDRVLRWLREQFPRGSAKKSGYKTNLDFDTEDGDLRLYVARESDPDQGVTCWTTHQDPKPDELRTIASTIRDRIHRRR